jgi:hypothetical protein
MTETHELVASLARKFKGLYAIAILKPLIMARISLDLTAGCPYRKLPSAVV